MAFRLKAGDEILEGRVFRRIPNWKSRFTLATGRPKIGVFRPPTEDRGELSTHLEELVSQEKLLEIMDADPMLQAFGLCVLDVRTIKDRGQGRTRAIYDPDQADPLLGHAHVRFPNLDAPWLQGILLELAEMIRPPRTPLE